MNENIKEIKNKTISGLIWRFSERILAQLISFVVSVILARILVPEQYGIIAIVTIFINLANAFVSNGLGTSLVQNKDADKKDFSTMFWAGLVLSIILYVILFVSAPLIAKIYNNELLITIIRVMGLRLPIASINSIQQAYVSKNLIYRKFFFSTIIGTIISAIIGISMALLGFGVWALVAQYLSNVCIDTIVLFITIKWRPKWEFSFERFKLLFSYGWKVMIAGVIGTFFEQLKGLVIGAKYTSSDLAFYNKGENIPALIGNNVSTTIDSVLFPAISKLQEDKSNVKKAISRSIKTSSFFIIPIMFAIAAIADTFVKVVLTEKWMFCVPYIRIFCIYQCVAILGSANLQAMKAVGRSDILLKLEFIKKPIYLAMILITMQISPLSIAIGNLIYSIIALIINSYPNRKLVNYSILEQVKDIIKPLLMSIVMSLIVLSIGLININSIVLMLIQIIAGMTIYIWLAIITKDENFYYIINTFKKMIKKDN